MNELAPISQNPEKEVDYLHEHPDAVVNPDKARVMAEASQGREEAVVVARGLALEAARNIGDRSFRDSENRGAEHAATIQAKNAQKARAEANSQAEKAAEIYDTVKGF